MDYYYAKEKVNCYNPDVMHISSYHKQCGDQVTFVLNEYEYMEIAEYIRTLLNIHPKIEKANGKTTKQWMIDEDRMNMAQRDEKNTSTLLQFDRIKGYSWRDTLIIECFENSFDWIFGVRAFGTQAFF